MQKKTTFSKIKIVFILLMFPLLNFGQTTTQLLNGYYNASVNYGFSCNVQVQITKSISREKVVFKSKLLSVQMADTKGWYDNSINKYHSCDLIGNYCVIFPQFLDVTIEYGRLPFDSYSFAYVGEEKVIYESTVSIFKSVVGFDASTFTIQGISQTIITHKRDAPIWSKLQQIRENGSNVSATSTSNSNPLSSSITTTNPLPYTAPTSNDKFTRDVQNATIIVNGLADLLTPSDEEIARREREQLLKSQLNAKGSQLVVDARNEFQQYITTNPNLLPTANDGNKESRKVLIDKAVLLYHKYSALMDVNGLNILKQEESYFALQDNLYDLLGGIKTLNEWQEDELKEYGASNNHEDIKKAADIYKAHYLINKGEEKEKYKQAMLKLYIKAADKGNLEALMVLTEGLCERDIEFSERIKYLKQGMEAGCAICFYRYGEYYYNEEYKYKHIAKKIRDAGFEIDNQKVIDYFLLAIEADKTKNTVDDCNLSYRKEDLYKILSSLYKEKGDKEKAKEYKELYKKEK